MMKQKGGTNLSMIWIIIGGIVICLVVVALISVFLSYPRFHQQALDARLWRAALRNDTSAVEYLLRQGANVNVKDENENPLLDDMLASHNVETAHVVLRHKPDVNAVNPRIGCSLTLILASGSGADDIVAELIEQGADVNARTLHRNTPLMSAVRGKHPTTISYLLAHGADRDVRDTYGKTALMQAQRKLDQTPYPKRKAELAAIVKLLQQ